MKVFLRSTHVGTEQINSIIAKLKCKYYIPELENLSEKANEEVERQKQVCDYHLYIVALSDAADFSVSEAVNDSKEMGERCIFCILNNNIKGKKKLLQNLEASAKIIANNGGVVCKSLEEAISLINDKAFKKMEEDLAYYKKWSNHISHYFYKLINEILPSDYYNLANDSWQGAAEDYEECVRRLNRPFVKRILKH